MYYMQVLSRKSLSGIVFLKVYINLPYFTVAGYI